MFLKFETVLICSKINTEYGDIISRKIITLQRGLNNFSITKVKSFSKLLHVHIKSVTKISPKTSEYNHILKKRL